MKIKNDKGEEIDVFTAAETEERIQNAQKEAAEKAVQDYKTANPDKADEINKLKTDLEQAQKDLEEAEKGDDKDGQVKRLRKERDEALDKVNTVVTDITKKFDEFTSSGLLEVKDELLTRLSNGNVEMRKKIELEFDNYRPNDKTKKGIQDRMAVAAQIVTGTKPKPGFMENISGGGDKGNGGGGNNSNKTELTPNQKAIGNVLGITNKDREDYEKYKASRNQ